MVISVKKLIGYAMSQIFKSRISFEKSQLNNAGRTIALFRHDDVGNTLFYGNCLLSLAFLAFEHFLAVDEDDNVGILLQSAGLPQIC